MTKIEKMNGADMSALDTVMQLTPEQRKKFASAFDLPDTNEALEKKLAEENRLVANFHDKCPGFEEEVQKATDFIVSEFQIPDDQRSPMMIGGPLACALENGSHLEADGGGTHDPRTNKAFVILSQKELDQFTSLRYELIYLHEFIHGAGYDPNPNKYYRSTGFRNTALNEGLVDYLALQYTCAMNDANPEDTHQLSKDEYNDIYGFFYIALFKSLTSQVPEKLFYDAYFHGRYQELQDEIENVYGPGSYDIFVKGKEDFDIREQKVLASHWQECTALMDYLNGGGIKIDPERVDKKVMDDLLKRRFEKEFSADDKIYRNNNYKTTEEAKAQISALEQKYPPILTHLMYMGLPEKYRTEEEDNALEQYLNEKVASCYETTETSHQS